jgi:hypothetical protein
MLRHGFTCHNCGFARRNPQGWVCPADASPPVVAKAELWNAMRSAKGCQSAMHGRPCPFGANVAAGPIMSPSMIVLHHTRAYKQKHPEYKASADRIGKGAILQTKKVSLGQFKKMLEDPDVEFVCVNCHKILEGELHEP